MVSSSRRALTRILLAAGASAWLLLASLVPASSAQADGTDKQQIHALLKAIARADAVFVRNGTKHTPQEARDHIAYKLKVAREGYLGWGKPKKISVEQFIRQIASRSHGSGRPYQVVPRGAKPVHAERWLRAQLRDWQQARALATSGTPSPAARAVRTARTSAPSSS